MGAGKRREKPHASHSNRVDKRETGKSRLFHFSRKIGIDCSELKDKGRKLVFFHSHNANVSFILVKAVDVLTYVEHGVADIGIVGKRCDNGE
ncbi:hypothetical protein GCM10020331_069120 [Ectobacillus funiculus]